MGERTFGDGLPEPLCEDLRPLAVGVSEHNQEFIADAVDDENRSGNCL